MVLVAPVWKTQPWYPLLLQMLVAILHLLVHNQVRIASRSTGSCPSDRRVVYPQGQRYRDQKLSEEATSLMLKSWRTKTNRYYNSLFGKWHSWCSSRGSDPFSGPIKEVVNFLAHLYKEGWISISIPQFIPFGNLIRCMRE